MWGNSSSVIDSTHWTRWVIVCSESNDVYCISAEIRNTIYAQIERRPVLRVYYIVLLLRYISHWSFKSYLIHSCVGVEVLTAMAMKISVSSDITPCSLVEVNRPFGGTHRFRLHGERINQQNRAMLAACFMLISCLVCCLTLRRYVPPKRQLVFPRLHGVTRRYNSYYIHFYFLLLVIFVAANVTGYKSCTLQTILLFYSSV
jgi:hypothetical protein